MATYREIHGKPIKFLSSDLDKDNQAGEIFYNSTSDSFKSIVQSTAFISATPMPVAKSTYHRAGTMTAGLFCAGNSSTGFTTSTEEWNGLGFSQGGAIGTALYSNTGFGTQTAGASAAGRPTNGSSGDTNATFEYDGSSWTSVNAANLAARTRQSFGIQTAGAMVGGFQQTTATYNNNTEEYDGTNWTTGTAMPANAGSANCMGTQTAAIVGLGGAPTTVSTYIAYDGTNWTTSPSSNIARARSAAGGTGATNTAGLVFGGAPYSPTASATAETWDGTSFSSSPASLTTARYGAGISDGNTNGMMVGGYQGTAFQSAVEEFNSSTNLVTAAAFSSGNSQNLNSYNRSGWGTQNAAWLAGGTYPSDKNESEEYDGTTWTEGNNLNTARGAAAVGGSQTAAIFATGNRTTNVEHYNGTSWTAQPASPQARSTAAGGGTQSSFVMAGGSTAGSPYYPISTTGEEWNGSSWTSSGTLPAPQGSMNGSALGESESAAILAGGAKSPAGPPGYVPHVVTNTSLDYGGTSWTANPNINTARVAPYFFGTTSLGILAGGDTNNSGSMTAISEQWNGSVFVTGVNMATGRYTGGRAGTATAGLVAGGYPGTPGSVGNATEEYTGETTAANVKTITTS